MSDRIISTLSPNRMVLAGVRKNWRTSTAVAVGVALATAVIVGALLVGDSMRGSLRELTIERLGSIESVVAPGGFFSASDAAATLGVPAEKVAPIIPMPSPICQTRLDDDDSFDGFGGGGGGGADEEKNLPFVFLEPISLRPASRDPRDTIRLREELL